MISFWLDAQAILEHVSNTCIHLQKNLLCAVLSAACCWSCHPASCSACIQFSLIAIRCREGIDNLSSFICNTLDHQSSVTLKQTSLTSAHTRIHTQDLLPLPLHGRCKPLRPAAFRAQRHPAKRVAGVSTPCRAPGALHLLHGGVQVSAMGYANSLLKHTERNAKEKCKGHQRIFKGEADSIFPFPTAGCKGVAGLAAACGPSRL